MLSKSDEDILNDRLRNWGRWTSARRHARSTIIYRMMVQAGEIKLEPSDPYRQIDIFDALLGTVLGECLLNVRRDIGLLSGRWLLTMPFRG